MQALLRRLSNPSGSVTSSIAPLTVLSANAPVIVDQPQDLNDSLRLQHCPYGDQRPAFSR